MHIITHGYVRMSTVIIQQSHRLPTHILLSCRDVFRGGINENEGLENVFQDLFKMQSVYGISCSVEKGFSTWKLEGMSRLPLTDEGLHPFLMQVLRSPLCGVPRGYSSKGTRICSVWGKTPVSPLAVPILDDGAWTYGPVHWVDRVALSCVTEVPLTGIQPMFCSCLWAGKCNLHMSKCVSHLRAGATTWVWVKSASHWDQLWVPVFPWERDGLEFNANNKTILKAVLYQCLLPSKCHPAPRFQMVPLASLPTLWRILVCVSLTGQLCTKSRVSSYVRIEHSASL